MTQWRLAALTTSVLAILAACLPMGALFGSTRIVPVVATALLVGTGIGLLGWWRRWPALWLILVGVAAFLVVAPPLAAPEALAGILPTFDAYGIVVPAVWQSWRDILTIAPPVGVGGGVLVAPLVLVLVGSAISSSIVLRLHRAELAGLVPVAIAAWTILFGTADPWSPVLHAVLVMSLVVVLVSIVRQARRRRAAPRTLSTLWRRSIASLTVAAAAIGCGIVGGAAMVGDRVVLRTDPVVLDTSDLDSPLSAFRASHDPDRRDDTVLVATGMRQGDRLTVAVLDAYDGVVAGVGDAAFVRMPAVPPTGDDVLGVAVQDLEGPWLPHVGDPASVGFVGARAAVLQASLHADADTGDLLATAGIEAGDAYEVSFARAATVDDLATLSPAGAPRLDVVPPADAVAWLSGWTEDATTPGERLAALVAGLAADGYLSHGVEGDPASRAGHSVARIAELFDGVMVGDGEQYAVAAALLAEQLGFPARIVVGYVPQTIVDGEPTTVVAGDLDAWVEVSTQEAGWVAIGVTPQSRPIPEEESTAPQPSTQPQPPAAPVLPEGGVDRGEQPADPVQPPSQAVEDGLLRTVLGIVAATLGGMLLVASPVLVVLGAKLLRRRRRRLASSRADRVEGAWKEFVDATVDRGRDRRPGATRLETARGDREVAFAAAIDRALFGRLDPDDAAADAAWEAGDDLLDGLDHDRTWLERLRARLSLRSLRGAEAPQALVVHRASRRCSGVRGGARHRACVPDRLQLPTPPAEPPAASFPVLASLAPVVGAGALWLVTQLSSMLLFALLGPVIAIAGLGDGRMQRRRARRREAARFARDCDALDDGIRAAHADEARALTDAHPDARARAPRRPRTIPHRWRHAAGQPVPVVLGVGAVPSSSAIDGYPHRQADDVQRRADALRAHAAEVDAPLVVDATLGIGVVAGPGVGDAHVRSLALQVLAQLSPRDAAVVVEADETWAWIDAVPHRVDRQVVDGGALVRILGDDLEVTIASRPTADSLPRDCRVVVEARLDVVRVGERTCAPELVSTFEAAVAAARLGEAAAHAGIGGATVLPSLVPLADLAQDAPGVLPATFLAAPHPMAIDLAVDGPHAVVGGTTGSGKSELLVAWIAALARRHDPADLAVLLVDFKGGASFEALRGLRHCVGVVTDLDEHGAARAIESLRAEIRHRERLLHAQGVRSIEEATGLGRLVIVVDEFAAMLHEQPDLLRLFADVAARGRSLGMHLILCTQRPAEAVRDAVLANCGVRISLRVPDDADAVAVTGVPDAARLRLDERGRCVVRIAGHATVHAQSALADPALLARLVADSHVHAAPRRPWCDPLPARIPAETLPAASGDGIVLGLVDRPSRQRVDPLVWRPAVDGPLLALGAAASGKSALVDLLARAGADVVRDEESLWDAVHEPIAPGVLAIDDVDALLARLDDEHAHEVAALLARRMREGAGVGHAVALTARRATAAMGQLAPLADTRVLLRLASRQEHALAGGAMDRYDATMPPGAAWVAGERVQLGLADASAVARTPQRVAMPSGPLAVVAATLDDVPRGLGATGTPAAPADVTVGTVGEWEAAWGALDRLRVGRPVVVLGVDDRVARQVLRGAPLSPVLRGERRWVLVGGVASRLA